jgi:N-methylhydantoinase A
VQSDGGIAPADEVKKKPVSLIRSGPAAGDYGSLFYARLLGIENLITFDMGAQALSELDNVRKA